MQKATLTRINKRVDVTLGVLRIEGLQHKPIHTLELPWRLNQNNVSCIPAGTYRVATRVSEKFGKHWILQNVPGRAYILIHSGNTTDDIQGCILVGLKTGTMENMPAVLESRAAMKYLRELMGEEPFELTIQGGA